MKIALIPPVSLLEYTTRTQVQLMLPHLVENKQYQYTYLSHGRDPYQYLILDNGVAEDKRFSAEQLFEIGDYFMVNEIVLPDVMRNAEKTRLESINFLDLAKEHYRGRILSKPHFMYVLQGESYGEVLNEIKWAAKQSMIDVFGLPRHLIATTGSNTIRRDLATVLQVHSINPVHLLGGSPQLPNEIALYEWPPNVRSHDTSAPFNYAWYYKKLDDNVEVHRPSRYFGKEAVSFKEELVDYNVKVLMGWAGYDV
jgi:hypothetical protein